MRILKRIVVIVLIITFILISFSYADTGKVKIEAARVREKASANATIVTVIYEDDVVEIIDESGDWYQIKYNEHKGFVKKDFLDVTKTNTNTNINTNSNVNTNTNSNTNTNMNTNVDTNTNTAEDTNAVVENTAEDVDTEGNVAVTRYKPKDLIDLKLLDTDVILREDVNLKAVPSFISKDSNSVAKGTTLKVVGEMNLWIQVTDGTVIGWMLKTKIANLSGLLKAAGADVEEVIEEDIPDVTVPETSEEDDVEDTTIPDIKTGYINVEGANVRASGDKNATVVGTLYKDDTVNILDEETDWYKVKHDEVEGYVSKSLVTINE